VALLNLTLAVLGASFVPYSTTSTPSATAASFFAQRDTDEDLCGRNGGGGDCASVPMVMYDSVAAEATHGSEGGEGVGGVGGDEFVG